MRSLKALLAHKSLKLNPYYKINHGLYNTKMIDLKTSIYFHKKYSEVIVFSRLEFKTLANYLSIYFKDLVHQANTK